MADNIHALVVPAALGRVEAFVASALAALSLREALVLALDSSRPSAHPFAERDAFAQPAGAGLMPLRPLGREGANMRFHILEQGGPTLSNNRWSLGATSTLGMHVAWTPAGERARVRTCTPAEAQRLAERHALWWWRWGREVGLVRGPFALPLPPWDLREPLAQLRVGDSLTSHHAATLQLLPGALMGQAAGLSLAAALHLGVEGAVVLGTLAGIARLGVGLHITRPSWFGRPPLGISVTRLGPTETSDAEAAAPELPEGDTSDVWWRVERRLFVGADAGAPAAHLPGESEPATVSIARARARATLLEVALESDDGAPWFAPSVDVPLLVAAHVGYGWRRGQRHTWLLDAVRPSGQLVLALLRDAQARSELKDDKRGLPRALWEAQLFATSRSASRELVMPGVSLGGVSWGSGRFVDVQTLVMKLRRSGVLQQATGVALTEERVRWGRGRRTTTLMSWGAPLPEDEATPPERASVLGEAQEHAEWHGLYSAVTPRAALLLAETLRPGGPETTLKPPPWQAARKGLRIAVRWQPAEHESHAAFIARHTPFSLREVTRDWAASSDVTQCDVQWGETQSLFEQVRWFIALLGHSAPSAAQEGQARTLVQKLHQEEAELREDPVLGRLAPAALARQLAECAALRETLVARAPQSAGPPPPEASAIATACAQVRSFIDALSTTALTDELRDESRAKSRELRAREAQLVAELSRVRAGATNAAHKLALSESKALRKALHAVHCLDCAVRQETAGSTKRAGS